VYNVYDVN
jgi:hypothetical protein